MSPAARSSESSTLAVSPVEKSLEVKDGYLLPPSGPGLGVEVDLEKAKAMAVQV